MTKTSTRFTSRAAPCGRSVDGEHLEVEDDDGLVTDELVYTCGCQSMRQEYHDGSFYRRVVRHDGRILVDEVISEHGG
jgi:hypothetical protein